jgi:NAD(P)H-hydrate epimerase
VLVLAGSRGKTGAAAMTGLAALKSGAGLVTVASADSAIGVIASHGAELMTEPLPETEVGSISPRSFDYGRLAALIENKDVVALGPGLGTHPETVSFVRRVIEETRKPMVIDADGLNALASWDRPFGLSPVRVLTPHPGEMARLTGKSAAQIQADRVGAARALALERQVTLVLKGYRTLIAFPDGAVWINPTGTPAMATGGTGDILTGAIAGLLAQFPAQPALAVAAAVYLHGLAGELGAARFGEKALLATDLMQFFPEGMRELAGAPNRL